MKLLKIFDINNATDDTEYEELFQESESSDHNISDDECESSDE